METTFGGNVQEKKQVPNVLRWASMSAFMRVSLATLILKHIHGDY